MALHIENLVFNLEKTTKNTYRYKEEPQGRERPKIGTLYLSHALFAGKNPDEQVVVNITTPAAGKKKKK